MSDLYVVFCVGSAEYVLPAEGTLQLESYAGATRVPGSAPHVAGLVQVRGQLVPVVDLRARFGLPPTELTLDARVVVVEAGGRLVGLLAERAREVVRLSPEQLKPPPGLVAEQSGGFVTAVAQLGTRLLMRLDFDKVIREEETHGE